MKRESSTKKVQDKEHERIVKFSEDNSAIANDYDVDGNAATNKFLDEVD